MQTQLNLEKREKKSKIKFNFKKFKGKESTAAIMFLAPAIILWGVWFLYPLIQSLLMSFQDFNYIKPEANQFIGLDNYIRLLKDPEFIKALKNSAILVLVVVPIQTFLALLIAVILNSNVKFKKFFRTIYYAPYVISPIAVATVFMYFFTKNSFLMNMFEKIGLPNETWFSNVSLALTFIAIIYVWQMIGFYMVIFLSGLQTVPEDVYEAATIDGANRFQIFRSITVPLLKPVIFLVITYGTIQAFQMFDQIVAVSTRGGGLGSPAGATSTVVSFFYQHSFKFRDMGYGSAAAIIFVLIIFAVTITQKKLIGKDDE